MVTHLFKDEIEDIRAQGEGEAFAGRPSPAKREFLDDVAEQNSRQAVKTLPRRC